MPTEQEIGQEIGLLLHAHGCDAAAHPDLAAALTRYAYTLHLDAIVAGVQTAVRVQQRVAAGLPRVEE